MRSRRICNVNRCLASAFMPLMNAMIAANSYPDNRSLLYSVFFVTVNTIGSNVTTLLPSS